MYTTVDEEHAIKEMEEFFEKYKDQLPADFPTKLILEELKLMISDNFFTFGNTYWFQLLGIAMGTSSCMWATIYYAIHE